MKKKNKYLIGIIAIIVMPKIIKAKICCWSIFSPNVNLIKIKLIFYITKIFTICLAFVTIVFLFKKNLKYNFNFV